MFNLKSAKGAVSESFITVIAIVAGIIIMLVFPISALSERNIDMAQSAMQAATTEFADTISVSGKITPSAYDTFVQKIDAIAGVPVDVEIEIQHTDENTGKKSSVTSSKLAGENPSYSTWDVETKLKNGNDYELKKSDKVIVTVTAQKKAFLKTTPTDLVATASSMIVNSGN
ncbi:MAG: hypothetical protein J5507_02270 [Clostridia bacterium]|nr:hypothetical protein [Clostridia bacterium]